MKAVRAKSQRLLVIILCLLPLAPALSGTKGEGDDTDGRRQFTFKDLPNDEPDPAGPSEIEEFARARGFRYGRDTRRAARGDAKALRQFFQLAHDADGAAAESIAGVPSMVYHLLGDNKFASFLDAQPMPFQMMVRSEIVSRTDLSSDAAYLRRYFPQTAQRLFRREMIDWVSPNGSYAVRKVFSDDLPLPGSKVVRAELIEKQSGRVICDLTADDIGTGTDREGEALWSADSQRVACLSSDLTEHKGNLFSTPRPAPLRRQTAVYQHFENGFRKVDLELGAPNPDKQTEEAIPGHFYTEPVEWRKPNVLFLKQHNYYRNRCR